MKRARRSILSATLGMLILGGPALAFQGVSAHRSAADEAVEGEAEYLGSETCLGCHTDQETWADRNPHGSEAFAALSDQGCETCHGPGSLHVEDPESEALQPRLEHWTELRQSETCLSCHGDTHPSFERSDHSLAGLSCTDCHGIHSRSGWAHDLDDDGAFDTQRISGVSALCVDCHEDVGTEFALNERHRLQEGILDCTSCHDPHEPATRTHLAGFKDQQCVTCHADKEGPFVFEHGSVQAEGCTACHTPHGSPNRHLLTFQNMGELCYSCHVEVPGFHLGFSPVGPPSFDLETNCTNCHTTIHGSNFDPFFLK